MRRRPKAESVLFVGSREEAEELGFRACRRCHPELDGGRAEYEREVTRRALALVDAHIAEVTPAAVAAGLGFSASHLGRLFRRRVGRTLAQHIRQRRLEMAAILLREGDARSVLAVGAAVGYESSSALYEGFQRRYGLSPGRYRAASVEQTEGGERS